MRALEVLRDARPAGVEAVGRAPGGGALVRDRADVCVEGVRRAGDPGQGEIDGHRRRAQVLVELCQLGGRRLHGGRRGGRGRGRRRDEFVVRVRPDDRALRERLAGRQLEFVPDGAADGRPRKRGCAVELMLHGLVGAQQERSQALWRDCRTVDPRLGDAGEREREHSENGEQQKTTDRNHPGLHRPLRREALGRAWLQQASRSENEGVSAGTAGDLERHGQALRLAARQGERRPPERREGVGEADQRLAHVQVAGGDSALERRRHDRQRRRQHQVEPVERLLDLALGTGGAAARPARRPGRARRSSARA